MSVLGNFNAFFFAVHLMDIAICFKTLGTILQSVTHNGKQLMLTVLLTSIVVYLYTVIAFNFFRKFYIMEEEEGEADYKCHDMASVSATTLVVSRNYFIQVIRQKSCLKYTYFMCAFIARIFTVTEY